MKEIPMEALAELFESVAARFREEAKHLCEMDANLGDGDLGLTLSKGFSAVPDFIRGNSENDAGKRLMKAGMQMASLVPSTMGTLMSSGLMNGGKAITGSTVLDAAGFAKFLEGFAAGIEKRGKCRRGDRTVLDSIGEAADYAAAVLAEKPDASLEEVAAAAKRGAEEGVRKTFSMKPKFGKAAVFAKKAVGLPDQGACAGLFFVEGLCRFIV